MTIDPAELDISYFKAPGPGGQKKNKAATAVRLRHRPSGLVVTAGERRSRLANLARAMERLEQRLADSQRQAPPRIATRPGKGAVEERLQMKKRRSERKTQRRRLTDGW
ncbi:peptide chain release factor-like protein [Desulfuromonas sp. CSMB_57]|jgi:protein subunit release factor B|uniref:peptide chain release factor family protein n=1 Tax=Desulfuromonas sp. CSMB_57 TaxID=2807629 RepID=UPI001CD55C52|nr:peptide chain release factor-like protein [Desulfuromonas sp. CSMB_57]